MSRNIASLALGLVVVAAAACGGAQQSETEGGDDEMVGAPPSSAESPFRIEETPETAKEAGTSGYLEDEKSSSEGEGGEDSVAVRASKAEPGDGKRPEQEGRGTRCFSCVRICPIRSGGDTRCRGRERDVICGWGVHDDAETARRLARAECNGALDMARRMKTWSRIEGECPPADCRKSDSEEVSAGSDGQ